MKKFEEELFSKVPCKFGLSTEGEYRQSILVKHFGDWVSPEDHKAEIAKLKNEIDWLHNLLDGRNEEVLQTVKQLNKAIPEIPESLAKIIETHDLSVLGDWEKVVKLLSEEALTWLSQTDNVSAVLGKAATLCYLKIKGYTVAKEKRFYLKNKLTGQRLIRLLEENGGGFLECVTSTNKERMQFTQSEIDSMETGSYEQIEVEE